MPSTLHHPLNHKQFRGFGGTSVDPPTPDPTDGTELIRNHYQTVVYETEVGSAIFFGGPLPLGPQQ